jgi:hypothetical protein
MRVKSLICCPGGVVILTIGKLELVKLTWQKASPPTKQNKMPIDFILVKVKNILELIKHL